MRFSRTNIALAFACSPIRQLQKSCDRRMQRHASFPAPRPILRNQLKLNIFLMRFRTDMRLTVKLGHDTRARMRLSNRPGAGRTAWPCFTCLPGTALLEDWGCRSVAQPGSASVWGTGGRGFESRRSDHAFKGLENSLLPGDWPGWQRSVENAPAALRNRHSHASDRGLGDGADGAPRASRCRRPRGSASSGHDHETVCRGALAPLPRQCCCQAYLFHIRNLHILPATQAGNPVRRMAHHRGEDRSVSVRKVHV